MEYTRIEEKSSKTYKRVFFFLMIAFLIYNLIIFYVTDGYSANTMFFYDKTDSFMDFYNSMVNSALPDPYDAGIIYPPLNEVLYKLFSAGIPTETFNSVIVEPTSAVQPVSIKTMQEFTLPFIAYFVIFGFMLAISLYHLIDGSKFEKTSFAFLILLSSPYLFLFERGNMVLVALIFTLLFFLFYKSEEKNIT